MSEHKTGNPIGQPSATNCNTPEPSALRHLPLYTWLLAIYPVLFVFSQNVGEVFESEVWLSIAAAPLGASGLFALMWGITHSAPKAGALTAICALAFFSYGHVLNLTHTPEVLLVILYAVIVLAAATLIVRHDETAIHRATPTLNIVALALVLMTLPPILSYVYRGHIQSASAFDDPNDHPRLLDSAERPDIYYIVLDAYSANSHFLRDYGYDNSAFTDALEERGFFVAYDSMTTYGVTLVSLGASLNMRYIDANDQEAAQSFRSDEDYFRSLMTDSQVAHDLQARGYTYIYMMSGFTTPSTIADANVDFYPSGAQYYFASDDPADPQEVVKFYQRPFFPLLLETTAAHTLADTAAYVQEQAAASGDDAPYLFWRPERALLTWDEAEKIPTVPEATFSLIHIIKPHEPIAFTREGQIIPYPYVKYDQPYDMVRDAFFEQVEFTNTRTLQLIDTIIASSDVPPIIILQGDHGSTLGRPESHDQRRTNFEIMNAYYIPQSPSCISDPAIIPINTFRALFNCLFGTNFPMLESRFYAMPDNYDDLFNTVPVDIDAWRSQHSGSQP
jgi:hypothetical protein